jgi:outer membrane protein assembly factor BamB
MRSLWSVAAVAIALIACGGGADTSRLGPATPPARTQSAPPSATQPFNLDDMMGLYATQTVFVADTEKISAITLLNHFTRYTIPTNGKAQVAADAYGAYTAQAPNAAGWIYVLDGIIDAPGPLRLRTFDIAGVERASRSDVGTVASTVRSLAVTIDGRVLVLKADARHAWVDAYEPITLKPQGTVMEKAGCGDRLLASGFRVAIVCLATGQIAVDTLRGGGTALIDGALPDLAGAAMVDDGTMYAVTADRKLAVIAPNTTKLSPLPWPSEWSGSVLPDTLAAATGSNSIVLAQLAEDGAWLRTFASNNVSQRQSVRLAGRLEGAPQFGLIALAPFAYFTSGGNVRHVEISTGMLETMTTVGQGATVVAVVNR